jgi:hypothetical protein
VIILTPLGDSLRPVMIAMAWGETYAAVRMQKVVKPELILGTYLYILP